MHSDCPLSTDISFGIELSRPLSDTYLSFILNPVPRVKRASFSLQDSVYSCPHLLAPYPVVSSPLRSVGQERFPARSRARGYLEPRHS